MQLPALYIWLYTHEHLLRLVSELQLEISYISTNQTTSVSKRFYFSICYRATLCAGSNLTSERDGLLFILRKRRCIMAILAPYGISPLNRFCAAKILLFFEMCKKLYKNARKMLAIYKIPNLSDKKILIRQSRCIHTKSGSLGRFCVYERKTSVCL